MISDKENIVRNRGLNIVVMDNETGLVVDSVIFDTHIKDKAATRINPSYYLRAYEGVVCF